MSRDNTIVNSFLQGQQIGLQRQANQANIDLQRAQLQNEVLKQQQMQAQSQLSQLAQQGDPEALNRLASINPQQALNIREVQSRKAVRGAQLGQALLSAPASARPSLYPRLLEQARAEGLDTSSLPSEYSPEAEQLVRFTVSSGRDLEKQIESQAAPTPLSPEGKLQADIKSGLVTPGTISPERKEKAFKQASDLRKEFTKNSGEFIKSKDAFDRVQASAKDPSAAGDLALIFNFMKVLDPGSTVREGEFANAQNAGGVSDRVRALFNNVSKGQRLSTTQRDDFVGRSTKLFNKALKSQERRVGQFKGIAKRNNLPVEDVILDLVGENPSNLEAVNIVERSTAPSQDDIQAEIRRRGLN